MIKVEDIKNLKKADTKLIKALRQELSKIEFHSEEGSIENFSFKFNDISYSLITINEDEWTSEGKYEYSSVDYQLVSFDEAKDSYPCEESILDTFNISINQSVSRSGSYFSDWYYTYDEPSIAVIQAKHIPEQIIPAHDEIEYKNI